MKYYILDDDMNIVKILSTIIESDFNRKVVGFKDDPNQAVDDIIVLKPDVVLIDYLMPGLDGVDVIKKIKSVVPEVEFIMISQVSDKNMIGEAYKEGLSFFISKPINRYEVNAVLKHMSEKLETSRKLSQIINLIGSPEATVAVNQVEVSKSVLKELGIYSEKGSKDMIGIIELKLSEDSNLERALENFCDINKEKSKIVRQRMRRAIMRGLRNLSYLGIEDYMNELFVKYSSSLYDFEAVKKEMDYIRGVSKNRGTASIDKFLEVLSEF